ncbi:MAG: shikimate / quinate 5-dehydrogenase family protein [Frankiales bacterium]|nr:shikimate / quinate 5-dehydrogenase family protein [Frankiales bacterium]
MLGRPVSHSLSPQLHRAAYRALGLTDWSYDAIDCGEDELSQLVADAPPTTVGFSCTMPLKRQVLAVADAQSRQATQIGAANTLLRRDGGWFADNTDWIGIRIALAERGVTLDGASVAVLGAGGTAQSALAALGHAGRVSVLVRNAARTTELRGAAERMNRPIHIASLADTELLMTSDVVIATLPATAADHLANLRWRDNQTLLDVIYHPWPTVLAHSFSARGGIVVSGAAMLLHQAARQVELMTGCAAPVEAMRAALLAAAPACGA